MIHADYDPGYVRYAIDSKEDYLTLMELQGYMGLGSLDEIMDCINCSSCTAMVPESMQRIINTIHADLRRDDVPADAGLRWVRLNYNYESLSC
jgi:hypothetical protein